MTTARALPKDEVQLYAAAGPAWQHPTSSAGADLLPNLELGFRAGVRDRMDLRLRLGQLGVQADLKNTVVQSRWFDLAIDPALSLNLASGLPGADLRSSLIAGLNFRGEPLQTGASGVTIAATPIGHVLAVPTSQKWWVQGHVSVGIWSEVNPELTVTLEASRLFTIVPLRPFTPFPGTLNQLAVGFHYRPFSPAPPPTEPESDVSSPP